MLRARLHGLLALGAPFVVACGRKVDSGPPRDLTFDFPEMLRTCPECGDYFADDAPPFCPADGTQLAEAGPPELDEGARVVEEKTKLVRRFKLRRAVTTVMILLVTLIVTLMVAFVVAANYVVYLKPSSEPASTHTSTPTPAREK